MVKTAKTMPKFSRVFLVVLLLNTLLFSGVISIQRAIVKKGELRLSFSKSLKKSDVKHFTLKNPHREIYDFTNTRLGHKRVPLGLGANVRMAQYKANTVRVVISGYKSSKPTAYQPLFSKNKYHISLPKNSSVLPAKRYKKPKVKSKKVTKNSHKYELVVIDAGHGGHDSGAIGGGKKEKNLVLQIAKRLKKQLKKRGHPVHMTRKKDRFLKLPQRTKIADKKKASNMKVGIIMCIIGGLGHILGGIFGVGFWFILERILEIVTTSLNTAYPDHITWFVSIREIVFGLVIVLFLIFEPDGLAARWRTMRAYWKLWPFSY